MGNTLIQQIELTPHQKEGLLLLEKSYNSNAVSCLSGFAGTGKSTVIGYFVKSLGITPEQVVYLTYTGKASTVLQSKGLSSLTIHSFLYNCGYRDWETRYSIRKIGRAHV